MPALAAYRQRIADLSVAVKPDRTLLTEADVVVQNLIVAAIRRHEPDALILAEEDGLTGARGEIASCAGRVWVVDPIDGTSQFVCGNAVEFCSVVCLLEDWRPVEAFVLAPELGIGRSALVVTCDVAAGMLLLNGHRARLAGPAAGGEWLSATRSGGEPSRRLDAAATRSGYRVKTSTTSQTLDLVRTVLDLSVVTDPPLPSFALFWRRRQKVWDGVAGLCLAAAAGLRVCDEFGRPLEIGPRLLGEPTPTFASSVVGQPQTVHWFLQAVHA